MLQHQKIVNPKNFYDKISISNNLLADLSSIYSASFLTVYPVHEMDLRKAVTYPIPVRYFNEKLFTSYELRVTSYELKNVHLTPNPGLV